MLNDAPNLANTVMFTMATKGYLPFVLNLRESLARVGLGDALVAYTLDEDSYASLVAVGVKVTAFIQSPNVEESSLYGTPGFARIMSCKYAAGLAILEAGRNALYLDSDVVVLRDPFPYLREVLAETSADLVMQVESPEMDFNAGVWLGRPTPPTMTLLRHLGGQLQDQERFVCDQQVLNEWVRTDSSLRVAGLDPVLFACGNQFIPSTSRRPGHRQRCAQFPFDKAYLLHFNYLVSDLSKVRAMSDHAAVFHQPLQDQLRSPIERLRTLVRRLRQSP